MSRSRKQAFARADAEDPGRQVESMPKFTTFYAWLGKQKNLHSPLGAWAREALRDPSFPKDVATLEALQAHLRTHEATSATLATARLAWLNYARTGAKTP